MNRSENSVTGRAVFLAIWIFPAMLSFSGCTPEKAGALRNAALLFRSDARAAVHAVRELMDSEIASPQRSDAAKTEEFVKSIMSLSKDDVLSSEVIELASDPYAIKLSAQELRARQEALDKIQKQYDVFGSMFDDLERGSFLARGKVATTKQYAVALTGQMANLADFFTQKPPRFIQKRAALMADIDAIRKDAGISVEQRRQRLAEMKGSWEQLLSDEAVLQHNVVEKCSRAAASGQIVLQMIDVYNKLSVDELSKLGESIATIGEQISGRSLASMKAQNEKVLGYLNSNPEYKVLLQPALDGVASKAISHN